MWFASQPCALHTHLNFQTWSETEVFSAFWLRNALRATAACNFWHFIPPDGFAPAALPFLTFQFSAALEEQRVLRFCYLFTLFDLLCCDSFFSDSLLCLFLWLLLPLLLHLSISRNFRRWDAGMYSSFWPVTLVFLPEACWVVSSQHLRFSLFCCNCQQLRRADCTVILIFLAVGACNRTCIARCFFLNFIVSQVDGGPP